MYLETERLIIRPPKVEDSLEAYNFMKNEQATRFVGGQTNLKFKEFDVKFKILCKKYTTNSIYEYSVELKETNKYIGYSGFQDCDILHDTALIYGLKPEYWGLGYGFEAANITLEYGFKQLKLKQIKTAVHPANRSSEQILRKLGLKYTGEIDWPKQGILKVYAITKEEYAKDN